MTEPTWKIVFFDNRIGREGTHSYDDERSFYLGIESIKSDHWLKFIKGILPDGKEIKA